MLLAIQIHFSLQENLSGSGRNCGNNQMNIIIDYQASLGAASLSEMIVLENKTKVT